MGSLVGFRPVLHPPILVRHQGEPAVRFFLGEATAEVTGMEEKLEKARAELSGAVAVETSGGILDWEEARRELLLALLLGLLLVFLVLTAIYESFRIPLAVFGVIPFAILGGGVALKLAGQGLDLASGLGFILLCGLAVNNGVLLVDRLRYCPEELSEWSRRASLRLRPVLVTTLTTLATLAPVAFMGGTGASLRTTLALTVFSGLLVSTPAALFLLPPLARLLLPVDRRGEAEKKEKEAPS